MKVSLKSPITVILLACFALFLTILPAGDSESATMTDYCMTPPFIVGGVTPNLLLLLDNSASMYDLYYVDNGTSARKGGYCYDQTYASTTAYVGYFYFRTRGAPQYVLQDVAMGFGLFASTPPTTPSPSPGRNGALAATPSRPGGRSQRVEAAG